MRTYGRTAWTAVVLLAASMTLHAQPCVENYTAQGSPATGMTFRTWQEFWNVGREEAFARAQAAVAQDGYVITSADNANGVISTTQGVSGSTARVPYNIVVAEEGTGSRVSLTFGTTGGMVLNQQDVLRQFCKTLSAVGR